MLRTGRPITRSKWRSAEWNADLEDAMPRVPVPLILNQSRRFTVTTPRHSPICLRLVMCTFLLFFLGSILSFFRIASGGSGLKRAVSQKQNDHNATSYARLNQIKSRPIGKPLRVSSLSKPSQIDGAKLKARLAKLEAQYPDDFDLRVETEAVADDLRHAYGLSRWPPLISRVPSVSGHRHEEYSVDTADLLFCSNTPCKVLLPVWTRPLSPNQQLVQIQMLIDIAKRLNRTIVLPNAGHVTSNATEQTLLGVGICHRYPFARYFDASSILSASIQKEADRAQKSAVPMQPFLEWVRYRPGHASAQVVVVDSTRSNDTRDLSFVMGGAEIKTDEHAVRGRGAHKNCLSSRASKLKLGSRPTFIISPAREQVSETAILSDLHAEGRGNESKHGISASTHVDGIVAFLRGAESSFDDLCHDSGTSSCSASNAATGLGNPDVLVLEWDLDPDFANFNASKEGSATLDYSPRFYTLAAHVLSTLKRPLIMLRSKRDSLANSTDGVVPSERMNLTSLMPELLEYLQFLFPVPEIGPTNSEAEGDQVVIEVDSSINDAEGKAEETGDPGLVPKQGTVWLDRFLAHRRTQWHRGNNLEDSSVEATCEAGDTNSPDFEGSILDVLQADEMFKNFTVVDLESAISSIGSHSLRSLAGIGKHGEEDDEVTLRILEDIVERSVDRVFSVPTMDDKLM